MTSLDYKTHVGTREKANGLEKKSGIRSSKCRANSCPGTTPGTNTSWLETPVQPGHIPVTSDHSRCEDAHSSRVVHIPIPLIPDVLRSQGPPLLLTCAGDDQEQVVDSQAPGSYSCGQPHPDANTQLLLQLGHSIERLESLIEKAESQGKIT